MKYITKEVRIGVLLSKYSVGGGFQFKVYQKGKVIKTVKVKKDDIFSICVFDFSCKSCVLWALSEL